MRIFGKKTPTEPSAAAKQAERAVQELRERADMIHRDREYLFRRNHLAERIGKLYEGTT